MKRVVDISSSEKLTILEQIYLGILSVYNLPFTVYQYTFENLTTQVSKGFKGVLGSFKKESTERALLVDFMDNTFVFSAAKTFQQVNDMSNFVFTKDGYKTSFTEFKKNASKIFDVYNEDWLRTEMDTAYHVAEGGRQWHDIWKNRDILPLLEYQTVGDERVRDSHKVLDGVVKPVNDTFWNTKYPPNGWNCRCITISHERGEKEVTKGNIDFEPEKLFNFNAGKDRYIFSPLHPYYKVEDRYEVLKERNFNLPKPNFGS